MCMIDWADNDGQWLKPPHAVTGRKDHRCENCGRQIPKGESSWTGSWLEPGEGMSSFRYCVHCVAAAAWLNKVCNGHLWGGDSIMEDLAEHWDESPEFQCRSFAHLLAAMRRGWADTSLKKAENLTKHATAHAVNVLSAKEPTHAT